MKKMRLLFLLSIFDLNKSIFAADCDPEELRRAPKISLAEFEAIQDDDQALEEAIRLSLLKDNHKEITEMKAFQTQNGQFNQNEINSLCVLQGQKVDVDEKSESDQKKIITRLSLDQLLENSNFIKLTGEFLMQIKNDHEEKNGIDVLKDNIHTYESLLAFSEVAHEISYIQDALAESRALLSQMERKLEKLDYIQALHKKFVFKDGQEQEYRFTEEEAKTILDTIF